jgi:RHS repeat-associated protein
VVGRTEPTTVVWTSTNLMAGTPTQPVRQHSVRRDEHGRHPEGSAVYTATYAYDTLDRLTSNPLGSCTHGDPTHLHGVTAIGTTYTASYDAAGNMICRGTSAQVLCGQSGGAQLSWYADGTLSNWQNAPAKPTTTDAFLYDGEGNRVEQQVSSGSTTTSTVYVGNLEEVATSGTTTTTTTYYYAASQRIAEAVNGVLSYLGSDSLGSGQVTLSSSGTVQASVLYSPYGSTRYSSGAMPGSYAYAGQRADGATGLDLFGARYYDPVAGQFASADTVLPGNGYDAWGLSRYAYVAGNPETRTDPSGHDWFSSMVHAATTVAHTVSAVAHAVAPVASAVLDATTGIPSMINDVHTIFFDPHASGMQKLLAAGDLLMNAAMDASMLVGVGEGLRVVVAGAKIAGHVAEDVGMHAVEHAGVDAVEHAAEHVGEDAAEHVGEDEASHAAEGAATECPLSFAAATLVATPTGEKPIAALKVGDAVTAYDPTTGKASTQMVQATYITHDKDLLDVTLRVSEKPAAEAAAHQGLPSTATAALAGKARDEVVHTTANHPWFTADHGWQLAGVLHMGEPVERVDGSVAMVVAIHVVPGAASMWDLTVSKLHTFAVGSGGYVVHNCGNTGNEPGIPGDPANKVAGQSNLYHGQAADPFELDKNGWRQVGTTRSGPVHANVFGKDFAAFLRSQGRSVAGWRYYMEEWVRGPGERIVNHFWSDMFEHPDNPLYFHHH